MYSVNTNVLSIKFWQKKKAAVHKALWYIRICKVYKWYLYLKSAKERARVLRSHLEWASTSSDLGQTCSVEWRHRPQIAHILFIGAQPRRWAQAVSMGGLAARSLFLGTISCNSTTSIQFMNQPQEMQAVECEIGNLSHICVCALNMIKQNFAVTRWQWRCVFSPPPKHVPPSPVSRRCALLCGAPSGITVPVTLRKIERCPNRSHSSSAASAVCSLLANGLSSV